MRMLTAPEMDWQIEALKSQPNKYDAASRELLEQLYQIIRQLENCGPNNRRAFWFCAPRGTIEEYGSYEEYYEAGEVNSPEEFEALWKQEYSAERSWYFFEAIEDDDFKAIFINHKRVIEVGGCYEEERWLEASLFLSGLILAAEEVVAQVRAGTYYERIYREVPLTCRFGTILRKDFYDVFPAYREGYRSELTEEEISTFLSLMRAKNWDEESPKKMPTMSSGDYFRFCAYGYEALGRNRDGAMTPRELYRKYADGRDEGLTSLKEDDPQQFENWLINRERGGHPWEVCRGGNSTHISLYVKKREDGYVLALTGSSYSRSAETIKFFLALVEKGVPVRLISAKEIAARLEETDKLGIVPSFMPPFYCQSYFKDGSMLDFLHLPENFPEDQLDKITWLPLEDARLDNDEEEEMREEYDFSNARENPYAPV